MTTEKLCDFCPDRATATHQYPCAPHTTVIAAGHVAVVSDAVWFACEGCAPYIADGDQRGLLERAGARVPRGSALADLAAMHAGFFANRQPSAVA